MLRPPRRFAGLSAAMLALSVALTGPAAIAQDVPAAEARKPQAAPSIGSDPVKSDKPATKPYLADGAGPDAVAILPPPPGGHSALETADRAAFNATRALKGTPRWELATNDIAEGGAALLADFSCVLGQRIDQTRVPALMTLLDRARLDVARSTREAKKRYRRLRPFIGNEAPICVARDPELANSFSYPSGHSTQGWAFALIMAQLLPEKATPFLVRGRLYGESRVVCGVHWLSDVVAARMVGAAVFAVLQASPAYRADVERARDELSKVVAAGGPKPDAAICAREEAAAQEPLP